MRIIVILFLIHFQSCAQQLEEPLAFPGAEGFGKYTSGGRGGKVLIVTNLNDDGPGSLRQAIKRKESRTIIFAVSGNIILKSPIEINYGDLTLAGQTAPGDGICIRDYPLKIEADNVVVRYLRFRLGDESQQQEDAIGGSRTKNVMIDHCSISWATDECASFYYNENFTMQWCIISESLNESVHQKGAHGYGGIWGGSGASFHHNLIANHNSRTPRFSGSSTVPNREGELVDFRNNVIYNWMNNNVYGGEKGKYNLVNNYYKPGPSTSRSKDDRLIEPYEPYGKFFLDGNFLEGNEKVSANNFFGISADHPDSVMVAVPFAVEAISKQSAQESYDLVLKYAGASLKRDAVDTRIIDEVRNNNASSGKNYDGIIDSQTEVGGWPDLKSLPAPFDTDQDGMPDEWEISKGLNPTDASDAVKYTLSKSYTNVEVYINSLIKN